ncbi:MAG: Sporulation and cell division protein SsgA [Frankiales bacterium]|nr:Sporulation and cell division protein SsgA [Frankiales bacterium]
MASRSTPGYFCPLTLQLIGPRSWTDVPAVLGYDPGDPYAVQISFGEVGTAADGNPAADGGIAWLLGRELLRSGLDRPSGEGDVRIWPAHSAADVLFLHLQAPSGEALFELSRGTVAAFLRHTDAMVPPGDEGALLGLDDELAALLSNGGADPGR